MNLRNLSAQQKRRDLAHAAGRYLVGARRPAQVSYDT
jgi:hypothetical protein